jgi:hypothetical protein
LEVITGNHEKDSVSLRMRIDVEQQARATEKGRGQPRSPKPPLITLSLTRQNGFTAGFYV